MSSQTAVRFNCALTVIVYRIRRTNELQRKTGGGTKNPAPQVSKENTVTKFIKVSPENLKKKKTFTTFFTMKEISFPFQNSGFSIFVLCVHVDFMDFLALEVTDSKT